MKIILKNKIWNISILLVIFVLMGIFTQSCSFDEDSLSNNTIDSQKANLIALDYLELQGEQYVLNLSEKDAFVLGISKFDYDRMQKEIFEGNALIREYQAKGDQIVLNDPQENRVNISNIRLKNGNEKVYDNNRDKACYFTIPSTGAEGSAFAFVPNGAKKLKISFTCGCFLASCSGSITCGGVSVPYSIFGFSGGSTTINIPVSNTNMKVTGNTLCSGGGSISASYVY
jgi:hypothetical protein